MTGSKPEKQRFYREMKYLAIAFIAALNAGLAKERETRPHVVIFLTDDLSWSDCSPYQPGSGIPTPNLELLAREGMTFTHAFVASPPCAPSRAALLTGLIRNLKPESEHHTHVDKGIGGAHDEGFWESWTAKAGNDPAAAAVIARYHRRPAEELYHVADDPWELNNLAALPEHQGMLSQLRSRLDAEMRAERDEDVPNGEPRRPKRKEKPAR